MHVGKVPPAEVPIVRAATTAVAGQESHAAADIVPKADRAAPGSLDDGEELHR
jgi:hypothetical protein